jgi:hypothetical protein
MILHTCQPPPGLPPNTYDRGTQSFIVDLYYNGPRCPSQRRQCDSWHAALVIRAEAEANGGIADISNRNGQSL